MTAPTDRDREVAKSVTSLYAKTHSLYPQTPDDLSYYEDCVATALANRAEEQKKIDARISKEFKGHQDEDIRKIGLPTVGDTISTAILNDKVSSGE